MFKRMAAAVLMLAAGTAAAQSDHHGGGRGSVHGGGNSATHGGHGRFGLGVSGSRMNISVGGPRGFSRDRIPVVSAPSGHFPQPNHPHASPGFRPEHATGFAVGGRHVDDGLSGGAVVGGGGPSVGGVFKNDNLKVGVHAGSAGHHHEPTRHHDHHVDVHRVYVPAYYRSGYWGTGYSPWGTYSNGVQAVYPQMPAQDAAPAVVYAAEPTSSFEVGVLALQGGEPALAVAALRRHANQYPDDGRALRTLAVALLADKQVEDAGIILRQAYRTDPKLAGEPLVPLSLGFGERPFRDLVTRAVGHANRANTGSAWLLVASLMQAEGRLDLAKTMLARARANGLEPGIADAMAAEMR